MALQGWRLFGVTATIIIYIGGVIFLSMNNSVPSNHPRANSIERFAEFSNFRNPRFASSNRKIRWCTELKLLRTGLPKSATHNISHGGSNAGQAAPVVASDEDEYLGNEVTALVSFPGSGNTWLRYMLQQSTGILTGSIYHDYGLMKTGFPAENISNSSVIAVKTHEWGPVSMSKFTKALLLVRDPEKAIQAEFNRQSGGHVGFASPDRYKRTKGKYWKQFVTNKLRVWEEMNLSWSRNFTGPLKVIFYDDLVSNLESTLRDILNFLEVPIDESLLQCAILRREGIFRRKKRLLAFDPFTTQMRQQVAEKRREVYRLLGKTD